MKCFAVRRGGTKDRLDPKFILYGGHQTLLNVQTVTLGSLTVSEPEYGSGSRAVPMLSPNDIKYIRITDFNDDGIPLGHEFVTAEVIEEKYTLENEDVLFARSGATAGKTLIYTNDIGRAIFAGYCIRFRFNHEKVLPWFVYLYTKTARYQAWVKSIQRPSGQPNINKEEFKSFTIPLPTLDIQNILVTEVKAARDVWKRKLVQADALQNGLHIFVLDQLGLTLPLNFKRTAFAVKLNDARTRFDYDYHTPLFRSLRMMIEDGHYHVTSVGDICLTIEAGFAAGRGDQVYDDEEGIPHVRPFNITPSGEFSLESIKYVPRETTNKAKLLTKGELLFNNTNSTDWVGKTAVFDSNEVCTYSNHISKLVLKEGVAEPYFIAALFNALRAIGLFGLLSTNFNNQAGISTQTLSALRIPLPSLEQQIAIAAELTSRREAASQLRNEAVTEWEAAKARFEQKLLNTEV